MKLNKTELVNDGAHTMWVYGKEGNYIRWLQPGEKMVWVSLENGELPDIEDFEITREVKE